LVDRQRHAARSNRSKFSNAGEMNQRFLKHTRRTRTLAMFFIALYALASGRSLVPGMCATQAALDREAASIAAAYCCARPAPFQPHHDENSTQRPIPETRCALCQLALAACTAEPLVAYNKAENDETPYAVPEMPNLRFAAIADTNIGRDPPRALPS
jgi:hypothetical protein